MKTLLKTILTIITILTLIGCNSGGGIYHNNNGGVTFGDYPTPATPFPPVGTYKGIPYDKLGQPSDFTHDYPESFWPNKISTKQLQIAYGNNSESVLTNMTAYIVAAQEICSATPIHYDSKNDSTYLIGAAHCFVKSKSSATQVYPQEITNPLFVLVFQSAKRFIQYQTQAVYIPNDYCYNATYNSKGSCPNFSPENEANGGQRNDIAVIQIKGKFGDPTKYPQLAPADQYPQPNTMAPILTLGFGINTQSPDAPKNCLQFGDCGVLYAVANYQYMQQDAVGYHYLYNSYYNQNSFGTHGYTTLFCGGDSGGGDLFWNGKNWLLLSEHTYGPQAQCGTFNSYLPNASTNVSFYLGWINSIINK